ncbi:hypothetical protein PRIPAC_79394 [Pristionchus pacificus]|uniref:G protein-coupled receptor n=1 Tax=Pristionchus pacificus TaxID=54126 RepID=A0A2A6CNN4_PRIPA|nr:hypothetical protein PRIPAC_79394 [Pristionchus pacificus]|eukprot:PDM79804.1 G protein-coupled receptor [Pristionchus pacificus]
MSSVTKQQIFEFACILELNGICTEYGIDACGIAFVHPTKCIYESGANANMIELQEFKCTTTCFLLSLSLTFRLSALNTNSVHERHSFYLDLFTLTLGNCVMFYVIICFTASIIIRRKTIIKLKEMQGFLGTSTNSQQDMLAKALNLQLIVSSSFFLGCCLYNFNFIMLYLIPGFPETTPVVVPLSNLQNVVTAISNLYLITQYRR